MIDADAGPDCLLPPLLLGSKKGEHRAVPRDPCFLPAAPADTFYGHIISSGLTATVNKLRRQIDGTPSPRNRAA